MFGNSPRVDPSTDREITWFRISDRIWAARDDGLPAGMIGHDLTGDYIAFDRFGATIAAFVDEAEARRAVEIKHLETGARRRRRLVPFIGACSIGVRAAFSPGRR
jgi:hypothetical protein